METGSRPQQTELDPERQQKAREYARIRRRLSFVSMGIAAVAILFVFWSGLDIALRDWLQPLSWQPLRGWYPLQVLIYFLVLMLGYEVLTAPLAYYGGYVLPHRYGLSTMTLPAWLADLFKGLVLNSPAQTIADGHNHQTKDSGHQEQERHNGRIGQSQVVVLGVNCPV